MVRRRARALRRGFTAVGLTLIAALVAAPPHALGAEWTAPAVVSAGGEAYSPAAAAIPNGPALVAWSRSDGSTDHVEAAFAAEGVDFAAPVTVSSGQSAFAPAASLNPAGEAVVAWQQSDGARSRIYAALGSGGSFDSPVAVSPAGAHAFDAATAIAGDGTAVVVWRLADGPAQASIRRPGSGFATPQTLSGVNPALEPKVAALGSGAAVAAWRRWDGNRFRVEAALLAAGAAGFGAATTLSPSDGNALAPAVAGNASGGAAVAWRLMGTVFARTGGDPNARRRLRRYRVNLRHHRTGRRAADRTCCERRRTCHLVPVERWLRAGRSGAAPGRRILWPGADGLGR